MIDSSCIDSTHTHTCVCAHTICPPSPREMKPFPSFLGSFFPTCSTSVPPSPWMFGEGRGIFRDSRGTLWKSLSRELMCLNTAQVVCSSWVSASQLLDYICKIIARWLREWKRSVDLIFRSSLVSELEIVSGCESGALCPAFDAPKLGWWCWGCPSCLRDPSPE